MKSRREAPRCLQLALTHAECDQLQWPGEIKASGFAQGWHSGKTLIHS